MRAEKHIGSLAVMTLVLVCAVIQRLPQPAIAAPEPAAATPVPLLVRSDVHVTAFPRGFLSVRVTPKVAPLPTPVPPDEGWIGYVIPPPVAVVTAPSGPRSALAGLLPWPVIGPISTYFSSWHPGIDIVAICGTPVVSPVAGTVSWAGWRNNGGGNVLEIRSGELLVSLNHLSGFAVTAGSVSVGQVVAYVGTTGNSTGCHLHLGIQRGGLWVDPLPLLQ